MTAAYAGQVLAAGTPSAYQATYGPVYPGGVMAVQSDISGASAATVNNDVYLYLALTYNGAALNLTGYTVKAYLKATRTTPDSEAVVFTTSSGLTVTNASGGLVTWDIPHSDLPNPGTQWYRVDVIDATSEVFTCLYGNFVVQPA